MASKSVYDKVDETLYALEDPIIDWEVKQRLAQQSRNLNLWSTCNFVATISNLAFFILVILAWSPQCGEETGLLRLPWHSFTAPATKPELRPFDDNIEVFARSSKYTGPPRLELDEAWSDLLNGYHLRVPKEVTIPESTESQKTPVEVADGSGDRHAVLSVFHELDCLKTMREYMLPEYYPQTYKVYKPAPGEVIGSHIDRCFDVLRQSAMCHADTTLLPLEDDGTAAPRVALHSRHQCANWEVLQAWAVEHSVKPHIQGLMSQRRSVT